MAKWQIVIVQPRSTFEFLRTRWNVSARSRSNWNLKGLAFKERGKPEYLEKNLSKQRREPITNSTHISVDARICTQATKWYPRRVQFGIKHIISSIQKQAILSKVLWSKIFKYSTSYVECTIILNSSIRPLLCEEFQIDTRFPCFFFRWNCSTTA